MDTVSRWLELLKLEDLGFSQAEIVKELSQKLGCSERTVYYNFESRADWQPVIQSVVDSEAVLLKVVNRYEQICRQASVRLLTAANELAQLGALNMMLKANAALFEAAVLPEVLACVPRNMVFGGRYVFTPGGLNKARLINEEIARISRVVIHPKFRGIGLGAYLVKETLPRVDAKVVEALAVMAKYNPFFEKTGMLRV